MNTSDQVTTIVAFILFVILVFFFIITLAARYRKRKMETEELKARFVEERLRIQVEMQEETLSHISRELHDNLGHIASLIKISLNTIPVTDAKVEEKVEQARELTRRLIFDLKRLSVRLSADPVVDNGLLYAIEKEVDQLNKTGKFTANLQVDGTVPVMENDKAVIIYRMVQEVINNFIKHSGGSELKITILCMENFISLELRDNGTGFNIGEKQRKEGAGLRNLRQRARLTGASLDVTSAVGHGTTTIIKFST